MKITYSVILLLTSCFGMDGIKSRPEEVSKGSEENTPSFYEFKIPSLEGDTIDFSKYKGKKILIVNVASKCGNTPQYADLQKLHEQYGSKVSILGFPSSDFLNQEPGSNKEIREFCKKNYGVTFQLFEKVHVKGKDKHPIYQWLSDKNLNGWNEVEPNWNFAKYLINEKGELLKFFPAKVNPLSKEVIEAIDK
jgi:glutathione peroxidase